MYEYQTSFKNVTYDASVIKPAGKTTFMQQNPDWFSWHQKLAQVISNIGNTYLIPDLIAAISQLVSFSSPMAIYYASGHRPVVLYQEEDNVEKLDGYLNGAYILDPFYRVSQEKTQNGMYHLHSLIADNFKRTEYYRTYYKKAGIRDEIVFISQLTKDSSLHLSLFRLDSEARFSKNQLLILDSIAPVILELMQQYHKHELLNSNRSKQQSLYVQIEKALSSFGSSVLTGRERAILQLILRGHSNKSIAKNLGVSIDTVKLHKKNLYKKLNVASHTQLFSLFIDSLAS